MRKFLFLLFASAIIQSVQAQITPLVTIDDLEVIDTGNITRERWRDSLLRMDMSLVPTGFLLEYSLFGFGSEKYDDIVNDDVTFSIPPTLVRVCTKNHCKKSDPPFIKNLNLKTVEKWQVYVW